ncbi:hypothetical protein POTOM_030949 [Populus tomentosa]|uniref:non-specific serine/threonine protein kinase n=1 Tax=Populus tomentosa TaxID=118781 RepID=A0A8X7Z6K5_POPTO|nr:hypothetical protein POTOM_030949 [Populus tomentosa]
MDLDNDGFVEKDPTGRYVRYDEILGGVAVKTVYRAFDEFDGVQVAWKQASVEDVSQKQPERWTSEARLLKSLKNKNIIKFYDFWIDDEKNTLTMITEIFISGSLSQYCKKHKDVDTKAIKNWARQILRDLGLAIVTQQPTGLSDLGTPTYMAPELCEDEYNELVDVYKMVISGVKPASLNKVNDPQVKQFIEKCLVPASLRLPAIELLKDPFLATENSKDTVSGSMKLPNNLMPKQEINLPHSESRSMDIDDKKLLVGSCKESIDEKLQFSTLEICKFTGKNEFRLRGEKIDSNTISLNLNITETSFSLERKVEFPFHLDSDTAVSVAEEMVEQLELSPEDAAYNAELIDILVMKLVPSWKTSRGSIANAPERHPDCLQSVRDQEAQ